MKLAASDRSQRALTSIEVMVIVVLLLLLAAVLVPWLTANVSLKARAERQKCHNIQRSMALGYRVFANDNDDKFPFATTNLLAGSNDHTLWLHFQAMSNELGSSSILICPADRERIGNMKRNFGAGMDGLGSAGNAGVSYAGSLDANETLPNTILLLDRNLVTNTANMRGNVLLAVSNLASPDWDQRMHKLRGNAALADGSVQQVENSGLANLVRIQGLATNRLLLPLLP